MIWLILRSQYFPQNFRHFLAKILNIMWKVYYVHKKVVDNFSFHSWNIDHFMLLNWAYLIKYSSGFLFHSIFHEFSIILCCLHSHSLTLFSINKHRTIQASWERMFWHGRGSKTIQEERMKSNYIKKSHIEDEILNPSSKCIEKMIVFL